MSRELLTYSLTDLLTSPLRGELMLDEVAHVLDGELFAEVLHAGVSFESGQVGKRHALLELRHAGGVYLAIFDVLGIGEDVFREQLTALDLDSERFLEAEHDIEEVDRLGAEVTLERGNWLYFVLIDAERIDQRFLN